MSGVGGDTTLTGAVIGLLSKKLDCSMRGVMGVAGDEASMEELSVRSWSLRKLLSKVEKSESWLELTDEPEDSVDLPIEGMSGALRAWTLVVEINSVGKEIMSRRMLPAAYLMVLLRLGATSVSSRFMRLVKARAIDMVVDGVGG